MPARVIVAEDEPTIRAVLVDVLKDEGFRVRAAVDGRAALALHLIEPADVILSDVMMSGLGGPGLLAKLRARGDRTPVVLMSAAPPPPDLGDAAWLAKPFDLVDAIDAVRAAVRTT